jgi:hypothetical protein
MVAPVVLITSGVLVGNGLLATYTVVLDRIRDLKRLRIEAPRGEMLHEIDRQLATRLYRVRRLHAAVLIIFGGTSSLVLSVVAIAVAEASRSEAFGVLAVCLIFAGLVAMHAGLVIVTIAYRTDWRLLMPRPASWLWPLESRSPTSPGYPASPGAGRYQSPSAGPRRR